MRAPELRPATLADIPAMHRVRLAVRENRLVSTRLLERDYVEALTLGGRGWVALAEGEVIGFSVGNARTGNIWALFVDPRHEGRGHGRRLHDALVHWLWSTGLELLWLTTSPGTRAQGFYEAAGWRPAGLTGAGEVRYELRRELALADRGDG